MDLAGVSRCMSNDFSCQGVPRAKVTNIYLFLMEVKGDDRYLRSVNARG